MATKVFVGNLSFKIGEEKLREEFSVAGNVLSANIITRGPRSLGYGFVEFASLADAENSVQLLNKKDIDGREINVEVAKPRAEPPQGEKPAGDDKEGRPARRRVRRPKAPRSDAPQTQSGPREPRQPRSEGGAPRRQYRPRTNTGGNAEGGQVHNNTGRNVNSNNNAGNNTNARPKQQRPFRGRNRNQSGGPQPQQQQQQTQQTFQRKKPAPQPKKVQERCVAYLSFLSPIKIINIAPIIRVSSSTTLFVANLPFSVDDKELAEIFSKNLKVVSAKVVKKRNTRSKGFGFVEFENEADQQAALKEFDGSTVHERVLNVKVALTAIPGEDETPGTEKPAEGEAAKHEEKKEEAPKAAEPAKEGKAEAAAPAAAEGEEKKSGQ